MTELRLSPAAPGTRIVLPGLPTAQPAAGFPLLATLAPVAVSGAIWVVTGSAFVLLFAGLGPAVALASVADGRRQRRRRDRMERRRFLAEATDCRSAIDELHDREREARIAGARTASGVLAATRHDPDRWSIASTGAVPVTLGRGRVTSSVIVDEPGTARAIAGAGADLVRARRELAERARALLGAPVLANGIDGIGVIGPAALALPIARGYLLQVAALVSPSAWSVRFEGEDLQWCGDLPHAAGRQSSGAACPVAVFEAAGTDRQPPRSVVIAVAPSRESLPPGVRVVVQVGGQGGGATLVRHPDLDGGTLEVETVGFTQAHAAASWLSGVAREEPGASRGTVIPERVELRRVLESATPLAASPDLPAVAPDRSSLRCRFAVGAAGALDVDLVSAGPHAIVGGTTGSGKSELLISWVLALATAYPPRLLTVLLVDFKGGASFAALENLPHCVGVISDLDESTALRALDSLRAELRHRERVLASCGARSIDDLAPHPGTGRGAGPGPGLARLVIVVDEFAAMVSGFPDLHGLFADIAARGRSLGVHLVLGTQRPAGVVRDAVLANSGLRVSLRVNNRADSIAVVGDDSAAALPAGRRGRAMVSAAGAEAVEVQVGLAAAGDAVRAEAQWPAPADRVVRRPWLEPLAPAVSFSEVAAAGRPGVPGRVDAAWLPFALADRPDEQSQPVVGFTPETDGHLLVLGAARSGKSTLVDTLAAAAGAAGLEARRPSGIERTWDLLESLAGASERSEPVDAKGCLVLLDDLDLVYARLGEDYQAALIGLLATVLRNGGSPGPIVVITAQRIPAALGATLSACGTRVLLRHANKQDHLLAGGSAGLYDPALPPGGGYWNTAAGTDRIQVAMVPPGRPGAPGSSAGSGESGASVLIDCTASSFLVVSARPAERARRLRQDTGAGRVVELGASGHTGGDPLAIVRENGNTTGNTAGNDSGRVIIVGHPDAWQAHWGAVASLGQSIPVLYDGVSLADYRAVSRSRTLPPPSSGPAAAPELLLATPDGRVRRARWSQAVPDRSDHPRNPHQNEVPDS